VSDDIACCGAPCALMSKPQIVPFSIVFKSFPKQPLHGVSTPKSSIDDTSCLHSSLPEWSVIGWLSEGKELSEARAFIHDDETVRAHNNISSRLIYPPHYTSNCPKYIDRNHELNTPPNHSTPLRPARRCSQLELPRRSRRHHIRTRKSNSARPAMYVP
jgi:hypothetical protein